ncbi:MAG: hypothetical protein P1P85_00530 [Patescibacteria group bacterium]|nr:hypothetical protein [Patescibacteria group bacterium]
MGERKFFPGKGNIMEFDHKDDPDRNGNLSIEERLRKAEKWKSEKEERDKRLQEIKTEQERPVVISSTKMKELTVEQKKVKLEKLKEYFECLVSGEAPRIVKDNKGVMEEEFLYVKAEIKKLEEELKEG